MKIIARIKSPFVEKFGIPRQSGMAEAIVSQIIFEEEFRNDDALRGIEGFSHLWLIWQFSKAIREDWSPTVRPPRLGGNERVGVFATRSPFRPNPIGLSSVKLIGVEHTKSYGTILNITGADLLDGTPIYDIKPYLPYTDCHPDATEGFTSSYSGYQLNVEIESSLLTILPKNLQSGVIDMLRLDPRPAYQNDPDRVYGMRFDDYEVKFSVNDDTLTVKDIKKLS